MSVIVKLNFWSDDMVLAETISHLPDVELYDYRAIATDPQRPHLFFWTRVDDFDAYERAMADDETVAASECYGRREYAAGTERLYRIHVSEATDVVFYPVWVECRANVIDGGFVDGRWYGRMRFPDRDELGRIERFCAEHDVDLSVEAVYDGPAAQPASLTDPQQRTLALAAQMGYFDIPRRVSLADLATELGVSDQAVSERLRRAYRTLVECHIE